VALYVVTVISTVPVLPLDGARATSTVLESTVRLAAAAPPAAPLECDGLTSLSFF